MSPEAHQVWLGGSGGGDGSWDPLLCRSPAGRLVTQPVLITACVPGTAMPASIIPRGHQAQLCPCCLPQPGLSSSQAGSGQPRTPPSGSSLGVEVHNVPQDAIPGTGALRAPP